jgi:ATP dependent DNA ligase C terminal region
VVGGFRYNEATPVVGSLLLGLYGKDGLLHHVSFTSTIPAADKKALTLKLERLIAPPGFTGSAPGGPSRWSTGRSAQWQPLKPKLVVEVRYDHFAGHRFRHGTKLLRWRPDKSPRQCTMDQVRQKKAKPRETVAIGRWRENRFFGLITPATRAGKRESSQCCRSMELRRTIAASIVSVEFARTRCAIGPEQRRVGSAHEALRIRIPPSGTLTRICACERIDSLTRRDTEISLSPETGRF